ncbi:beta strand repeat-containing protein [Verminephrobacter eiseniae]|uniref:Outer membrane protein n=2 Tax=Verminephrobacter eiseniae TaxID=364317 RepID=A1WQP0_VEREI|nr:SwmB domain-containing protein [Verminephrobacter eiseniae]ABM59947.1 outer membrane protein [Verminephrobacter eiseniae EF01-2]MCW5285452.1 hypothetical protein [Verminephrobacter eiseniae]MCW5303752.1 hypothetical protein [Verminephrobacter eiseniae]MCW8190622.1 hypothetical protein [Verminephrobacter eiseniae]
MSTPIQLDFAGCSITRRDIGLDERTTVVTIKFNQVVRGFDTSDVVLIPGNGADATSVTAVTPDADGGSDTWQVTLTAKVAGATSRNDNRITVNLAGVRDAEGNAGSGTSTIPSEQVQYNVDLARPSVTQFGLNDANLTTNELAQSPRLTIKFTDVITGLDATNFVLSNGFTLTNLSVNLAVDFTGKTWTATLVPPSSVSTTAVTQASIALNVNNRGIKDAAGNEIKQGSDQSFNFTIDPVPPRLISIAISDQNLKSGDTATVTFTFDEAVQGFGSDKVTTPYGTLSALTSSADGTVWSGTLTPADNTLATGANSITVDINGVRDIAGNQAVGPIPASPTYTVDTQRPALIPGGITITDPNGDGVLAAGETATVTFTFTEAVTNVAAAVRPTAGGTLGALSTRDGGKTWSATFTPTPRLDRGTYNIELDISQVKDAADNFGAAGTSARSDNFVVDTLAPRLITEGATAPKLNDDGSRLVLTYTDADNLKSANFQGDAGFTVLVDGASRQISGVLVDATAKTVTLTLNSPVSNDQSVVSVSYRKPAGNNPTTIQDAAGNDVADFANQSVTNPDRTPPELITTGTSAPKVNGTQLVLSYTEANSLDPAALTGNAGFTVTSVTGTPITVSSASVNAANKTVTLTLSRAVENLEQVNVSYTKPTTGNVVQDAAGNDAANFTGQAVNNETPDTTPPALITTGTSAPKVNGTQLVLSYTEANGLDPATLTGNAGFTVTSASPGSTPITVNSASVNAANKTITLTLSRAVENLEQVSVSYTKPTTGNVVQDAAGNDAVDFAGQAVNNETPDTTSPALITTGTSAPKVNGTQLVLSYTEANSLDPAALTGNAGFTVTSVTGTPITVNSASVNAANKTVTLTLSRAVDNLEQVSVSYTKPTTGNVVQDAAGNDAANFTDQSVNTETPDTTPPALITTGTSAPKVNGTQLVLSYTEANSLDPAALTGNAGFTVTSASPGSTPITVTSASVNAANKTVTLTLSRAVENLEQVSVSYTKPTTGNVVQDAVGNDAANFTGQTVNNETPDTTPPALITTGTSAPKVNGTQLVLSYTEANSLDPAALTGNAGFTVTSASPGSTAITVNSASVNAANKTVTLTLSRAVDNLEQISVSYTKPATGNVVQDAAGNDAVDFTDQSVNNETPDTTPPALITTGTSAPKVNGTQLVLSYTEANSLDPAALTGNAGFTVTSVTGTPITVNSASVNAANKTVTLTLSRAVDNLEQVSVSYTKPTTGNVVQDAAGNDAANFTDQAVNTETPDTTPPALITTGTAAPKVNGRELVLSYTEANSLDPAALTGNAGFTVTSASPGSTPITVNSASVNAANKTVTLTLSRAVENLEPVSVSYTKPTTGNVVQDAAGNDAANFTGQTVNNETPDTTPPALITTGTSAPKVNGTQLVLSYTEANSLDPAALTGNAGFTVTSVTGAPITVNSASVNAANKTITLTLSRAVENLEQVSVSYTKPATGNVVQDATGNDAANFTDQAVNNETPDTTSPVLITTGTSAPKVNGTQLVLSYTEANSLDPATLTGNAGFTVTSVTGTPITVNSASVNAANKTVTLTLSRPVDNLEQVSVSYTKPTTGNVVQDAAGNDAANFTDQAVNTETPDTTPPALITTGTAAPKVNGRELVLSYTEANSLDPAALTGNAGFTVTSASPGSTPITVNSASVNAANKTVTLTLSRAVENLEQVSVSYTKPTTGNVVQDAAGNDAVDFTGQTVNNETPDTTPPALITTGTSAPKVNGTQLVLSYTEANSLDPVTLTGNAGFTVTSVTGTPITVNSASVNAANKTITLTLSRAVENLEQVSVSYTKPTTGNVVQDTVGNDAVDFTDQSVNSETPDTTPPALITTGTSAPKVNGTQLVLSYTEANSLDPAALTGSAGFTVTSASPDSTPITVNSASVNAANKTVTLTLSRAVDNLEQVSVSYTKPTTGNVVQDAAGNDAANFTDQTVNTETPDTTPPALITTGTSAPKVNGRELVLSYTEANSLDPAALTGNAGFTVTSTSPGSTPITVTSASVNAANKTVTLTLSRPVGNLEQVSVSYTKPTTGNVVQDAAGNDAANFTGQTVNNETPDTTPPALITTGTSAPKVNGTQLVLSYTEANSLNPATLTGNAGFTVTSASPDSTPITVNSASINAANKTVTLTFSRAVENLEQVSVSYTKPATGNVVQDTAGNDAVDFTDQSVNNETPDTTSPVLITTGTSAPKVNGTQLVLSYTEANSLDPAALTGNAGFTVTSASPGSTPITVNSASVNAANKTVTLTLSRAVDNLEQVSVSYTKPTTGNVVQDAAGNDAANFTDQAVNTETPDTTPPALITTGTSAPKVNGRELVLSYTEANSLDPAALTGNAGFTVTSVTGTPITVNSASVNAVNKTVTLTLSRAVENLEQVSVSYTKPTTGNVVQDAAGNDAVDFTGQTVNNETPDTTPPALITTGTSAPKVNGTQLVLSYTEANSLDPATLTGNAGFTVTSVTGTPITVNSASVNAANKTITLALSRAVENLEQVSVSYTKPTTGNVVQDTAGNDAVDFAGQAVNNETPDTTSPVLITTGTSAPKVNGTQLVLSYTEANSLDPAALTGNAGFTVTSVTGTPITVNSASVNAANKTVTLTLSRPVDNLEQVSVSYTKPTTGNVVQDAAGNDAANFTDQTVNTETPDTTPPVLITTGTSAPKVNGRELVLSYTEANSLDPAALTGNAGFTVTSASPGSTPITVNSASVNAANKTVTLTLSRAVENLEQVSVSYTKPTTGNVVQDAVGNDAANFTDQAVNTETPDTTPPALITTGTSAPKVNGTQLVLSYTEANSLDPVTLTGNTGFTVTSASPGSTPITVTSASVNAANKTVTLTLSRPVDNLEQVSVSYTKPTTGNVVQDAAGNDAVDFTDQAVNNETPDTTPPALITTGAAAPKVNGTQLVLSYTEANGLNPAALTGNAGFTVTSVTGTPITVTSAIVNAANKTVTLTLSRPVENLEQVRVSYTKPTTGNVVQDTAGNDAVDFAGQAVNNETPDTTSPVLITTGNSAPKVNGTQLVLSYTEANGLDPAALTGNAGFTVTSASPGSTPITVISASVDAANKTVTLTLSRDVAIGEVVSVSYTKPTTGNVVQDAAGNDAADFADQAVDNETPAPVTRPSPPKDLDTDNDGTPDNIENQAPMNGDGNGDGIADRVQAAVDSTTVVIRPSGASNPADAPTTSVSLVVSSQDGKVRPDGGARIVSLKQENAPAGLPSGLETPIGLLRFNVALAASGSRESFSLYLDPALGVNGYWAQDSRGNWVNLASEPYGGKMVTEGGRLRLDFQIEDGGQFDKDGKVDGVITGTGAAAYMPLSIVGQAPSAEHYGFWF